MTSDVAPHFQKHCPGCFQLKGGMAICPHCGYDESVQRSPLFLPHGTILSDHYRVGRVLGRPGGFGITYLGWDVNLQQRVAIKEYLPREIAQRMPNSLEVDVHTAEDRRGFEFGKEQFLREARIVAKLDHPNIVRVRNFFNANCTAYLVMDYYEGMSLGDYLSTVRTKLEPALALPLIKPILEGLQYVHERGLVHRDLKPHNIYLAAIGRPIVLDFGAARQAAGDRVQSLSVVLTEGYAPLEQYQRRAVQGPWTDVYGVAATLYRMITGTAPPIALDRIGRDPVEDGGWNAVPQPLVSTLRMALAVRPSDRYQSAVEFLSALEAYLSGSAAAAPTAATPSVVHAPKPAGTMPEPVSVELNTAEPSPTIIPASHTRPPVPAAPRVPPPPPRAIPPRPAPTIPPPKPVSPPSHRAAPQPAPAVHKASPTLGAPAMALPPFPSGAEPGTETRRMAANPTLYKRAPEIVPPPPPVRSPLLRWVAEGLLLCAAAALGYVLLNPPGPKQQIPVATRLDVAPVPVGATVGPRPVKTEVSQQIPPLPDVLLLPAGSVRLVEPSTDPARAAGGRSVSIASVRMGRTEITVSQFRAFVERTGYDNPRWQNYPCESAGGRLPNWDNPGYAQRDESPVVCVSWVDANAYTQWLSRETGQTYRLPTEAEWEYAARAGTQTRYWWGNDFKPGMATCLSCPPQVPTQPTLAAGAPANPFGLYETLGNVREWTCSRYDSYTSDAALQCGDVDESAQVSVRGGSWQQGGDELAAGFREAYEPYRRNVWTGFRIVQELPR